MAAFPPGGTFFDGKKSFAQVPVDESKSNAIGTTEFLDAAEALTGLFDILGSVAFKPVKADMTGNIKVHDYEHSDGGRSRMADLIIVESTRTSAREPH